MKKVLIISFDHNIPEIVGSIRCRGLAKHLKKFGWEPIVLTATFETNETFPYEVHQTNHFNQLDVWKKRFGFQINQAVNAQLNKPTLKNKKTLFDHLISILIDFIAYPDYIKKGWYPTAMIKAEEILSSIHVDAIISSFSPATCNLIAKELSQKYDIPWIADYRDLWTNSHYYPFSPLRRLVDTRLEKKTLSYASAITIVSQDLAEKLQELHHHLPIYVVENGFDPDQKENNHSTLTEQFSIVYTGSLYQGKRDPENLFKALKELIKNREINPKSISVDFYGYGEDWLHKDINRFNLRKIVKVHGTISRLESIKNQKSAQMLLLLTMNNPLDKGVYTGKLFDYLAAKRPILSIGYKYCAIKDLLEQTKAGIHVSEVAEIKKEIKNAYSNYLSNGCVPYNGIDREIKKYSHEEMAKKFVNVLNGVI